MFYCIDDVLTPEDLAWIQGELQEAEWIEGKTTAGWFAQGVKQNWQLKGGTPKTVAIQHFLKEKLYSHGLFCSLAQPKNLSLPLVSRYEVGMAYGVHTDNALVGDPPLRSDLSITLFLSDPATYGGGELVVDTGLGEQSFKLSAGSMVVYPSTLLHQVAPVTEGTRWVAVIWVQSWIRDGADREVLFELDTVRRSLFKASGKTLEFDLLCKVYSNLRRKWVDC
jgi:PKHD-type hydroxylase